MKAKNKDQQADRTMHMVVDGVGVTATPSSVGTLKRVRSNKTLYLVGIILRWIGIAGVVGPLCIALVQGVWGVIYLAGTTYIWIPGLVIAIAGHSIAAIWKPNN